MYGRVTVDVAYGGMFYVMADVSHFDLTLAAHKAKRDCEDWRDVESCGARAIGCKSSGESNIRGVSISQLSAPPTHPDAHRNNAVVVSAGSFAWDRPETWSASLDRSPCGTGTSARMAVMHAKGELPLGREFVHESMLGTLFTGRLVESVRKGAYLEVVPEISGTAWITGFANYVLDPSDPFPGGFVIGDLWPMSR